MPTCKQCSKGELHYPLCNRDQSNPGGSQEGLLEEGTLVLRPEGHLGVKWVKRAGRESAFQAEGSSGVKPLRWEGTEAHKDGQCGYSWRV